MQISRLTTRPVVAGARCHTHFHWCSRRLSQNSSSANWREHPVSIRKATKFGFSAFIGIACVATLTGYGLAYSRYGTGSQKTSVLPQLDPPVIEYASSDTTLRAINEIKSALNTSEDIISTDEEDLYSHSSSEWSSVNLDQRPVAIAYPRDTEQVSIIARVCNKWKVPIIPFSGGSSVEGHITAPYGGICLDFAFMDKIVRFDPDDMDVTVQPGISWTDLNRILLEKGSGYFFPIDPAPSAKIGGMVATNCSGTNAVRYGTMRDWVINLTLVLADGTVIKTRRRPRKCSAGYNLNGLFVGSEGTLGIVTEATLKLAVIPDYFSVAVVPFGSIRSAVSAATAIIRKGVPVAALELMDESQMRIVNQGGATRPRVWEEVPTLFLKFSGTRGTVADNISTTQEIIKPFSPGSFVFARDKQEQEALWSARKESLYSLLAARKEGEVMWNTDVAVPLSRLADIVEASKNEAAALGLNACIKGHVGDSNFHENITYNPSNPQELLSVEKAVKNMVHRALVMEGTCTGEHGIGYGKKDALLVEVGNDTIMVMKSLKEALDPNWIMNPGKIFDR